MRVITQNDVKYIAEIVNILKKEIKDNDSLYKLTKQLLRGAESGLELKDSFKSWIKNRFEYQFIWLDNDDYLKALVRALWLAPVFAGTDFGGSRQRDMAQVWTDTARGFLGEIAVSKFFSDKFNVRITLDTKRGELKEFLPTDITNIKLSNEGWRKPHLNMSIKTTKFNGRWLDVPGKQFDHSDIFILVKIGILRQHFLAFLKAISFLKDKLFARASKLGELGSEEANQLWKEIPEFNPVPAYVVGYLYKRDVNLPIHEIFCRRKGIKNIRIAITQGIGLFSPQTLRKDPRIYSIDKNESLPIEIEPIIESLTNVHFLAHSGGLKWGEESWKRLIDLI